MVGEEQVKELAYAIWEQEGRPEGKDMEHYYRARQTLEHQEAVHATEFGPPRPIAELPVPAPTIELATPPRRRPSRR